MNSSGRCHGPGCTQTAVVEFWCGEECQARWHGQIDSTTTRAVRVADETHVWITADLEPFQQAMDAAVRRLAEVAQIPADLLAPDGPTSEDLFRSHQPTRVAWGSPAVPTSRLRLAALGELDELELPRHEYARLPIAEFPLVASQPHDPTRGWLRRLFDRWKGQP